MDMILGRQRKTSRSSRWGMFLIMVKRRRGTRRRLSRWLTDSWVYVLGSMGGWISECSRWKAAETKAVEEGGTYTSRPPRGTVFAMVTIPSSNSRFNVCQISVWRSSCRTLSLEFFGLDSLGIHSTIVKGGDEPDLIFVNSRPRCKCQLWKHAPGALDMFSDVLGNVIFIHWGYSLMQCWCSIGRLSGKILVTL